MKKPRIAKSTNEDRLEVLKFQKVEVPSPYYYTSNTSDDRPVWYGADNLYPNFLLNLYNNSPAHSTAINTKAHYIIGDGLKTSEGKELSLNVNPTEKFPEIIQKAATDFLIYNFFAIEVIYNKLNEPVEYYHVPAHKIRSNKSKTKFWFKDNWQYNTQAIEYDRWKVYNSDSTSKIFFFDGYQPSIIDTYPLPDYHGGIKSILTDIQIKEFNLNQISTSFSVSNIITFFNGGNTDEKQKEETVRKIKQNFTGTSGDRVMVNFQLSTAQKPEVTNLSANGDWANLYNEVSKNVLDDIMRAHQITSPALFGIKEPGQLGNVQELETAYEIFKNTYIRSKRIELISAFNQLFSNSRIIKGTLSFFDKPLFNTQLSESLQEKIFTINELRKMAGKENLPNGDRLLSETPTTNPVPEEQPATILQKKTLTEDDFESVKELGVSKEEFEVITGGRYAFSLDDADSIELEFDVDTDIADHLINNVNNSIDIDQLTEQLKEKGIEITSKDLKDTLDRLNKAGIVQSDIKEGKVSIKPAKKPEAPKSGNVLVMYDYVKRPNVDGEPIIETTRGFCRKIINNNRYYSRADIQSMSGIFGYSIWDYGGGFYHNPNTNETTPHCRHTWKSVIVKRKAN